jgi:hypothetical protein
MSDRGIPYWFGFGPRPKLSTEEVLEANKPTRILADMIAADILANGIVITEHPANVLARHRYSDRLKTEKGRDTGRYEFINKTKVYTFNTCRQGYEDASQQTFAASDGVEFSFDERRTILEALIERKKFEVAEGIKRRRFERQQREADREAANQQRAIDAIEEFLGVGKFAKPPPDPAPIHETHLHSKQPVPGCEFSCCRKRPRKTETVHDFLAGNLQPESDLLQPLKEK